LGFSQLLNVRIVYYKLVARHKQRVAVEKVDCGGFVGYAGVSEDNARDIHGEIAVAAEHHALKYEHEQTGYADFARHALEYNAYKYNACYK